MVLKEITETTLCVLSVLFLVEIIKFWNEHIVIDKTIERIGSQEGRKFTAFSKVFKSTGTV